MSVQPTSTSVNTHVGGKGSLSHPIEMLRARFEDPVTRKSLKSFSKTIQISLTDLNEDYVFTIHEGELFALEKKSVANPDVAVIVASSLIEEILNKSANGILAFLTGKLKIRASRDDLMQLQKLMG